MGQEFSDSHDQQAEHCTPGPGRPRRGRNYRKTQSYRAHAKEIIPRLSRITGSNKTQNLAAGSPQESRASEFPLGEYKFRPRKTDGDVAMAMKDAFQHRARRSATLGAQPRAGPNPNNDLISERWTMIARDES